MLLNSSTKGRDTSDAINVDCHVFREGLFLVFGDHLDYVGGHRVLCDEGDVILIGSITSDYAVIGTYRWSYRVGWYILQVQIIHPQFAFGRVDPSSSIIRFYRSRFDRVFPSFLYRRDRRVC